MARTLPWAALPMLEAGGILYPVGMVLLVAERPRLWPRVFSYHEVFRILVIAGASGHFVVVAGCPVHLAGQAESCVAGPDRRR